MAIVSPMSHRIESIELFVREMPADRMSFSIGKQEKGGEGKGAKSRRPRAILLTRMRVASSDRGAKTGCAGDRPSFGWLDKRAEQSPEEKLTLLLDLVEMARDVYLDLGKEFETPFVLWLEAEAEVKRRAREMGAEDLMASYASALFERALIDACCRMEGASLFQALHEEKLGIDPGKVHPQLKGKKISDCLPGGPQFVFSIRHTVGLSDPITKVDWPEEKRINDGEPETLQEYVEEHGLTHFKIKISGDAEADLERLARIWFGALALLSEEQEVVITLDGNESYTDIEKFSSFVDRMESDLPGLFDHILFIEQPLTRGLTLDPETIPIVRKISRQKALVIDEADGTIDAFRKAFAIGYAGCSHKNCKGVFKSFLNLALCHHFEETTGREAFLSGEDLSNMPLIPLHQDFAALSALGLDHCERNGHHYAYGLSHLTAAEKARAQFDEDSLYEIRDGEVFLRIESGDVVCLAGGQIGFGSRTQPSWDALTPFDEWREKVKA